MAKKNQWDIVEKKPLYGKRKKANGESERLGTRIVTSDGVIITLLTPNGKAAKYAKEIRDNKRYTNSGEEKKNKRLTEHGRVYRSAYLQARKDSAKAYRAKKNNRPN